MAMSFLFLFFLLFVVSKKKLWESLLQKKIKTIGVSFFFPMAKYNFVPHLKCKVFLKKEKNVSKVPLKEKTNWVYA